MCIVMKEDIKRWTAKRKTALVLEIKEQHERQVKELQEAYGEAMMELRVRKNCSP